jgi:hypothetical protein
MSEPCPYVNISFSQFSLEDNFVVVTNSASKLKAKYAHFNVPPYSFSSYLITEFAVSDYQFCQIDQDTGSYSRSL